MPFAGYGADAHLAQLGFENGKRAASFSLRKAPSGSAEREKVLVEAVHEHLKTLVAAAQKLRSERDGEGGDEGGDESSDESSEGGGDKSGSKGGDESGKTGREDDVSSARNIVDMLHAIASDALKFDPTLRYSP
ncbi:hypothetical protein CC85DRAFT_163172 [Cutaneotrichosporon oleaginosum]|uniref:Uncharacterized protein n=1 Tax=Cutaneotrichosporon oleaginosum TaxID=879819 RepID=A0A0J1AXT3_9TREE|nr:uncharacterized protein CC85DRAFT_163172 [Cutaneotrichosporon oleaginosum]KLT40124.1 hypothetical protein CC85DRAFT_163172 [Cutaneotrichosporon oleaginosum]TXT04761.1 hypothetical protein COLE_07580 [Cutaneotrichosporon oleaginosum]